MTRKNITVIVSLALVLIIIFGIYFLFQPSKTTPNNFATTTPAVATTNVTNTNTTSVSIINNPETLAGIQTSTNTPWPPETDNLRVRLATIGLPALSQEGTALHIHQHMDIYIHGTHVNIPAFIGVNDTEGFISPIHTHDELNIIHVESPTIQKFTIGQFFDIWGLFFNDKCIGGYCTNSSASPTNTDNKLQVFVNGKEVLSDYRNIELTAYEEIVVTYGKTSELPSPVPSSFNFPAGL